MKKFTLFFLLATLLTACAPSARDVAEEVIAIQAEQTQTAVAAANAKCKNSDGGTYEVGEHEWFMGVEYVCTADGLGNAAFYLVDATQTPEAYHTMVPTATGTPTSETSEYCVSFGGNEGIPGNIEMVWLENRAALTAGHHYQYPWSTVSDITKVGVTVLDPTWEGLNDTKQGTFCKDNGKWTGWIEPRGDAHVNFYDGISYAQLVGDNTLRICVNDVNGECSGNMSDLTKRYTFDEARAKFGDLTTHLNNAQALTQQIDAGLITIKVDVMWVTMVWQKAQ